MAEASGENIFLVKDNVLITPPLTSVLPGITRDCVLTIARDLGLPVQEQRFPRDEIYIADESLSHRHGGWTDAWSGNLDERIIGSGKPGPVTKKIQEVYFAAVKGEKSEYASWLTYI